MKRKVKGIFAAVCALLLAFGAAACSNKAVTAYEIAVKNGFVGTETEWLRSLHGANGDDGEDMDAQAVYEALVAGGYTGSFLDFCKELGITMPQMNDTVQISENVNSVVSIYCSFPVKGGYEATGGSGVIVDLNKEGGNAYIITNYHVVYGDANVGISDNIWVYLYGALNDFDPVPSSDVEADAAKSGMRAQYVGGAMDYDIAILKVEGKEQLKNSNATEAKFGNSDKLHLGEETYVIGNPAGLGIAVTNGVLSVDSEYIEMGALDNRDENRDGVVDPVSYRVMRTSAAINSGNSGGGLFNTAGELIGIVNAKSASTGTDNMGYALPASQVEAVYENILANEGLVKQAYLGIYVKISSSKAMLDSDGNVSIVEEFQVADVAGFGDAAFGKLKKDSIFQSAQIEGGESVTFTRQYQLTDFLLKVRRGDTVTFTMRSGNQTETVTIQFNRDAYFKPYS